MGAARDAEQQSGPPGEEGPGGGEEQPSGTVRRAGGGGASGWAGGGLGADGCIPQSPWNIMIKHRQVQRRGRRSQMTTRYGRVGPPGAGCAGVEPGRACGERSGAAGPVPAPRLTPHLLPQLH